MRLLLPGSAGNWDTGGFRHKCRVARELTTPQEKIHEKLEADSPAEVIIEKIFSSAIETLSMNSETLKVKAVAASIDALCRARRIIIIGNGNSASIAADAQHKFLRLDLMPTHIRMIICR